MPLFVYQGTNPTVYINLTVRSGEAIVPFNASGYTIYLAAKQDYAATTFLFNIGATGLNAALNDAMTGLFAFPMTTGDTSYCAQNYPAGLTLVSPSSGISKAAIEGGFTILPTV